MNSVGPDSGLLDRRATADELRVWPLLHGSFRLRELRETIRASGLRAGGGTNSFEYDRVLSRTHYVFLAPPTIKGYGVGMVVVVDPSVIQIQGARAALYDIGDVVRQIELQITDQNRLMADWVHDPAQLTELIQQHRSWVEREADIEDVPSEIRPLYVATHTKKRVIAAPEFDEYARGYELEPEAFLSAMAENFGPTMRDLIRREDHGHMKPEILVPTEISPSYLLGCIIDRVWEPWAPSASPYTGERLKELVGLRTAY